MLSLCDRSLLPLRVPSRAALAIVVEAAPHPIEANGAASLVYVALIATAFADWTVVEVGRHIRAGTMSMALLATLTLGILISALTLGEAVEASLSPVSS